jgi:hypothetical protein
MNAKDSVKYFSVAARGLTGASRDPIPTKVRFKCAIFRQTSDASRFFLIQRHSSGQRGLRSAEGPA